jgi:hypothetical protein
MIEPMKKIIARSTSPTTANGEWSPSFTILFHLGECLIFRQSGLIPVLLNTACPAIFNLWNTNMSREVLVLSSVASAFAYCDVNGVIYDDDCNSGGW